MRTNDVHRDANDAAGLAGFATPPRADERVTVLIKALNEERHVARAIESALAAIAEAVPGRGEVILADSRSSDNTVAIAGRYPIRIARLSATAPRGCGTGPQLGFQYARGAFVCLIDGDMTLDPGFLSAALAFLADHPGVAGVGGTVRDVNIANLEFERRHRRGAADLRSGPVDRLNGGGLYRRRAIADVGHFSDRNLHGYEEFDLAVRLRGAGWSLHRLATPFVDHYGHVMGGYALLWRRIESRYLDGIGELLRGAVGRPHLAATLRDLPEIRLWLGIVAAWIVAIGLLILRPDLTGLAALAALALIPVVAMSLRYRSPALGLYTVVSWNAHAFGMIRGFLRGRESPDAWIASTLTVPGGEAGHAASHECPGTIPVRKPSASLLSESSAMAPLRELRRV